MMHSVGTLDNQDLVFEIDPYTGDTRTDGTVIVTGTSDFSGSVMLGDSPDDQIVVFGASLMYGDVTMPRLVGGGQEGRGGTRRRKSFSLPFPT